MSLYQTQQEIFNYFTGKEVNSELVTQNAQEELSIYKSLVLSGLEGLIEKILPFTYKILEDNWRAVIQLYFETCPCASPIYNDAVADFPKFLSTKVFLGKFSYPNYLADLALYEWTNLETYNAPNDDSRARVLELKYPILQVIEYLKTTEDEISEIRETDIEAEYEFLLSFRDEKTYDSKFMALDRTSFFVVKALERTSDREKIYIDFKEKFKTELANQDETGIRNAFDALLNTLSNYKILIEY